MVLNIWKKPKYSIDELQQEHKGNVRYRMKEVIGKGTHGKVIRAYDTKNKSDVAIKKIVLHSDVVKNYVREILLLKNNQHPNRLKLLDIYIPIDATDVQSMKTFYLVTEYVGQRALHSIIKDKNIYLAQENIAYMTYQILCAINHMHKSKLTHRDLKPENIGVTKAFHVKLLDYGFGRKLSSVKMTTHVGSENYLAPEVLNELPYNEKMDIWSIGCVLAELLKRKEIVFKQSGLHDPVKNCEYDWQEHYGDKLFQKYLNENSQKVCRYMSAKNGRDLLSKLLVYDHEKRIDANSALSHPYVFLWRIPAEIDMEPDNQDDLEHEMSRELLFKLIQKTAHEFHSTDSNNP